jgi:predicted nuclease of predicted toxin-antitoxin system
MSPYSFVIDMGVGKSIQQFLKTRNFTVHFIEVINSEMEDTAIIEFAREQQSIIITMDKDFGELILKRTKFMLVSCCLDLKMQLLMKN